MPRSSAISEMTEFQYSKDSLQQGDIWDMPVGPFEPGSQFFAVRKGKYLPRHWKVISIHYGLPGDVPLATLQCSATATTIKMFVTATEGNPLARLVHRNGKELSTATANTLGGLGKEQLKLIVGALNAQIASLKEREIMADSISSQYASLIKDSINAHQEVNDLVKEQLWTL